METTQVHRQVDKLFPSHGPRTTRVGVEHELLSSDSTTGVSVPISQIRRATRHGAYVDHLAFEPGGQVELSLPCAADPVALSAALRHHVTALRFDCAAVDVRLDATPVDPRPDDELPLQLTSSRYVAMQRHFDTIGLAGRTMMRRTASTQICLDWWNGPTGLEQWRLLNLAGPFLAAAFARSTGPTSRLATWLDVDPGRTAFDGRLLHGDDPVAAYTTFAAGATVFTEPGDLAQHLTTLFPPVRPRGTYLEVRFLDVQPLHAIEPLAAALSALLYDDRCRRAATQMVDDGADLGELWRGSADGDPDVRDRGLELVSLALTAANLVGAA